MGFPVSVDVRGCGGDLGWALDAAFAWLRAVDARFIHFGPTARCAGSRSLTRRPVCTANLERQGNARAMTGFTPHDSSKPAVQPHACGFDVNHRRARGVNG
jgi:hypothetical protein